MIITFANTFSGAYVAKTVTNNCLRSDLFPNKEVAELTVSNRRVPVLKAYSVSSFPALRSLSFNNSEIEVLQPFAFFNVPQLDVLKLTHNPIKTIPDKVFSGLNLKRLYLDNNDLRDISPGAFGNMRKLWEFHASNNDIHHYNVNWFVNSKELRLIDLRNNKLQNIPTNAFLHNAKLKKIHLDSNDISIIQDEAFNGLTAIEHLTLSGNKLKFLYPRMFPVNFSIRTLLLDWNELNYIPANVLDRIDVKDLEVTGNPLKCTCYGALKRHMASRNGKIRISQGCASVPPCGFPNNEYSNACTEHYEEDFSKFFFERYLQGTARGCAQFHYWFKLSNWNNLWLLIYVKYKKIKNSWPNCYFCVCFFYSAKYINMSNMFKK